MQPLKTESLFSLVFINPALKCKWLAFGKKMEYLLIEKNDSEKNMPVFHSIIGPFWIDIV